MINEKLNKGIYTGFWFLDGNEEKKVSGTLTFRNDGRIIFKTLENLIQEKSIQYYNNQINHHLVYGLAVDDIDKNHVIYLYNLAQIRNTVTSNRIDVVTYDVPIALIGKPIKHELQDSFNTLFLSSDSWQKFIKTTGFEKTEYGEEEFSSTHSYTQPNTINLHEDNDIKVEIYFRATSQHKRNELTIIERPFLNIEFKNEKTLREIFEVRIFFERLLMIFFGRTHTFSTTQVRTGENTDLHVYENRRIFDRSLGAKFKDEDLFETFSSLFLKWKEVEERFSMSIKAFFFALTDFKMDVNSQFLNYVFALEQFHKKLFGEQKEPMAEKNKPMYEKAVQELESEDVKKWLEQTFSKKKNVSFKNRLNALINEVDFGLISKNNIERIESTRHYLVHLDEQHKSLALTGEEVYKINEKLVSFIFKLLKKELEVATVKQLK